MPVATTITADPAWVNAASPMLAPPTVHHSGRWAPPCPASPESRHPEPEEHDNARLGKAAEREELQESS